MRGMRGKKLARPFWTLVAAGAMAVLALAGPAVGAAQASEIAGTVTGPGGTPPLAGVTICLSGTALATVCQESDADGAYTFTGLDPGSYGISYEPGEGQNYLPAVSNGFSLGSNQAVVLEERLRRGVEFEGHLTDGGTGLPIEPTGDPMTTTNVCALRSGDEEVVKCVPVGAGGEYALAGLPTGSYVVEFGADAKEGVVVFSDGYVRQYYRDKPKFREGLVEIVEAPNVLTGIDATLVRGEEIWPAEESEETPPSEPIDEEVTVPGGAVTGGGSGSGLSSGPGAVAVPSPPPLAAAPDRPARHQLQEGLPPGDEGRAVAMREVEEAPSEEAPRQAGRPSMTTARSVRSACVEFWSLRDQSRRVSG
ncbi:MAG TPA: carboxypeptidase-like regulatory domain-containing protein [Solirubrobacterales bacterium]